MGLDYIPGLASSASLWAGTHGGLLRDRPLALECNDLGDGLNGESRPNKGGASAHVEGHGGQARIYKWLWIPVGTLDLSLGFPASFVNVRRHKSQAKSLSPVLPSPSATSSGAMDRDWQDREHRGKRSFEESGRGGDRYRDEDLRFRLDHDQEAQRRQLRERKEEQARQWE